jgi:transposase
MGTAIPVKRRLGRRICAGVHARRRIPIRRVGYWPWLRFWTGRAAGLRRGSVEWIVRPYCDWVHAYNAKGPNGLINATSPGRPPKLTKVQKEKLRPITVAGPNPMKDGVVRWRCVDPKRVIKERFGVDLGEISVGRILKELGFSYVSARPQHPEQSPQVIEDF